MPFIIYNDLVINVNDIHIIEKTKMKSNTYGVIIYRYGIIITFNKQHLHKLENYFDSKMDRDNIYRNIINSLDIRWSDEKNEI